MKKTDIGMSSCNSCTEPVIAIVRGTGLVDLLDPTVPNSRSILQLVDGEWKMVYGKIVKFHVCNMGIVNALKQVRKEKFGGAWNETSGDVVA